MVRDDQITVVIPTIPVRNHLLKRAIDSVAAQSRPAEALSVRLDTRRQGAAVTRGLALEAVQTGWTAFLDDDDEFLPSHLDVCWRAAQDTGADFVYTWFETQPPGGDPFPEWFQHAPWDPDLPRHTTMTVLVRTDLAQTVGFVPAEPGSRFGNEDWRFIQACNQYGKIHHVPSIKTWIWHHDSGNTSGMPDRW